MTFKTNAIFAAALLAAFGAQAGTVSGNTVFATEGFGPTATAATTATLPAASAPTFSVATTGGIAVNVGGAIHYYLRLSSGKFNATPGALTGTVVTGAGLTSSAATLSADGTTARWTLSNGGATTAIVGVGATFVAGGVVLNEVAGVLGTAGGTISATGSLSALAPAATVPNTGAAQPADLDGAAATGVIATASKAVSITVDASSGKGKIDIAGTAPGTTYVGGDGTNVNFGLVKLADSTAVEAKPDGTGPVTVASATTGSVTTVVVTPGAGQSFPVGAQLGYAVGTSCATPTGLTTPAFSAATASAATTVTVAPADAASATGFSICLTAPVAPATAAPILPKLDVKLTNASVSGTPQADTATANGFALVLNGSQVDTVNYVPAAVAGWTQFLRIANTGGQNAAVSAAFINETTGAVGTSAVVIPSLAAGATVNLTATQVEAALGAQAAGARPRVRITAPTTGISVQNLLFTPNGSFTNNSSVQNETAPLNK